MAENESSKFKMRTDDEKPDFPAKEELDDLRFEKLKKRITRISIFITCLIGVVILFTYLDLKKSISITDSTGTMGVKTLSKELESKYSSLSVRQANLEDTLKKRVDAIEKSAASIQANLNKATTAIKYIRSARKADNKKIESAITTIEKRLSPLPNDLANLTSELKNIDHAFNKKLENLSQTVGSTKTNLVSIRSDIDILKSAKIDQKTINILLKNQQQTYQLALKKITSNFEDRIKSFEKKLKELEKIEKLPKN
jgi:chromosome segregation ATPase